MVLGGDGVGDEGMGVNAAGPGEHGDAWGEQQNKHHTHEYSKVLSIDEPYGPGGGQRCPGRGQGSGEGDGGSGERGAAGGDETDPVSERPDDGKGNGFQPAGEQAEDGCDEPQYGDGGHGGCGKQVGGDGDDRNAVAHERHDGHGDQVGGERHGQGSHDNVGKAGAADQGMKGWDRRNDAAGRGDGKGETVVGGQAGVIEDKADDHEGEGVAGRLGGGAEHDDEPDDAGGCRPEHRGVGPDDDDVAEQGERGDRGTSAGAAVGDEEHGRGGDQCHVGPGDRAEVGEPGGDEPLREFGGLAGGVAEHHCGDEGGGVATGVGGHGVGKGFSNPCSPLVEEVGATDGVGGGGKKQGVPETKIGGGDGVAVKFGERADGNVGALVGDDRQGDRVVVDAKLLDPPGVCAVGVGRGRGGDHRVDGGGVDNHYPDAGDQNPENPDDGGGEGEAHIPERHAHSHDEHQC